MFLVPLPVLTKSTYRKKFLCSVVDQNPPKQKKHLYPPEHQRDADLVDAAPAKTQSQRFSGERLWYAGKEKGRTDSICGFQLA